VGDPESTARTALIRSLLIYSAILAFDSVIVWYIVSSGVQGGGYLTLLLFGSLGVLLVYQVFQHILDIRSQLVETEGLVQRKWKRADLIIAWDSYYITVERAVFHLQVEQWIHLEEAMYVKVVHFPHTLNVVSVHELRPPVDPGTRI
jgi:hypothetical protein